MVGSELRPSIRAVLVGLIAGLAFAGGVISVQSCRMDSRPSGGEESKFALLPSPPEAYWNAYSNLAYGFYRTRIARRDPPRDKDILSFAVSSSSRWEKEIALRSILAVDREQSIPLLKSLATNALFDAEIRCDGIYFAIGHYDLFPESVPAWNRKTTEAFLPFLRWALENDVEKECAGVIPIVLLRCDPEWKSSDQRRRWLTMRMAAATNDSDRLFFQRQLDTMYDPPPPSPEPGKYLEIKILE